MVCMEVIIAVCQIFCSVSPRHLATSHLLFSVGGWGVCLAVMKTWIWKWALICKRKTSGVLFPSVTMAGNVWEHVHSISQLPEWLMSSFLCQPQSQCEPRTSFAAVSHWDLEFGHYCTVPQPILTDINIGIPHILIFNLLKLKKWTQSKKHCC